MPKEKTPKRRSSSTSCQSPRRAANQSRDSRKGLMLPPPNPQRPIGRKIVQIVQYPPWHAGIPDPPDPPWADTVYAHDPPLVPGDDGLIPPVFLGFSNLSHCYINSEGDVVAVCDGLLPFLCQHPNFRQDVPRDLCFKFQPIKLQHLENCGISVCVEDMTFKSVGVKPIDFAARKKDASFPSSIRPPWRELIFPPVSVKTEEPGTISLTRGQAVRNSEDPIDPRESKTFFWDRLFLGNGKREETDLMSRIGFWDGFLMSDEATAPVKGIQVMSTSRGLTRMMDGNDEVLRFYTRDSMRIWVYFNDVGGEPYATSFLIAVSSSTTRARLAWFICRSYDHLRTKLGVKNPPLETLRLNYLVHIRDDIWVPEMSAKINS